MKNIQERIHKIYNYYGPVIETQKFMEEMKELKEVIEKDDRKNISQEIADVYITCMHMLSKFNIPVNEVIKQIEYKVSRQEERIHREQLKEYNLNLKNKNKLNKYLDELIKREG